MFGIKRKINSTIIDNSAVGKLRGLGVNPIAAGKHVAEVRGRFKRRKLTHADTAVAELPTLIAAGVMEPEATLCAAARLAPFTEVHLSVITGLIARVAAQGKVTKRDLRTLESLGSPLSCAIELASGQPTTQVEQRAEQGDIDSLEFFDAIRITAKDLDR